MESTQIITYALALGIAAAIPGPGMIALVARSLSGGALSGFALLGGIIIGDIIYLSFAVFGLAVLAQSFHWLFALIKWGSVLYSVLLSLAILAHKSTDVLLWSLSQQAKTC